MARFIINPESSQVWIEGSSSVHPIKASASGLVGWVNVATTKTGLARAPKFDGELRIAVDELRSGNSLVDQETRRRIDAKRHPEIVGTVTSATRLSNRRVSVEGDLEFRGETCVVSGEVDVSRDGDDLLIEGEQTLDVRDWGLKPPRIGLLRVHPDVVVRIRLVAEPSRDT